MRDSVRITADSVPADSADTPRTRYRAMLADGAFSYDPAQAGAVEAFEELHHALTARARQPWWQRLARRDPAPVRGLYVWGSVGRGKTWLMDSFHDSLPFEARLRAHFHRFMREIHDALEGLRRHRDPLSRVAADLARRTRVICLDELFVGDITDAMLLGTLLDHLFARGICLVATSNTHPDELYRGGLQRERFLPAIDLIQRHTRVIELAGDTDFRLRALRQAEMYHWPLDAEADRSLARTFDRLTAEPWRADGELAINGRTIPAQRIGEGLAWLSFDSLCEGPRSQNDYLELARCFHTLLVSDIPVLEASRDDAARRFINLVDILYDHGVKLVASAEAPIDELYRGQRLAQEFRRTISRLHEMQSEAYLGLEHRPRAPS